MISLHRFKLYLIIPAEREIEKLICLFVTRALDQVYIIVFAYEIARNAEEKKKITKNHYDNSMPQTISICFG